MYDYKTGNQSNLILRQRQPIIFKLAKQSTNWIQAHKTINQSISSSQNNQPIEFKLTKQSTNQSQAHKTINQSNSSSQNNQPINLKLTKQSTNQTRAHKIINQWEKHFHCSPGCSMMPYAMVFWKQTNKPVVRQYTNAGNDLIRKHSFKNNSTLTCIGYSYFNTSKSSLLDGLQPAIQLSVFKWRSATDSLDFVTINHLYYTLIFNLILIYRYGECIISIDSIYWYYWYIVNNIKVKIWCCFVLCYLLWWFLYYFKQLSNWTCTQIQTISFLTLKVLNFWKFTSYCCLKPLWSGMGEVVPARTSPTLHPPSPPTVHQLLWLALYELTLSMEIMYLHSLFLPY